MCGCHSVAAISARRWKRARNWGSADTEAGQHPERVLAEPRMRGQVQPRRWRPRRAGERRCIPRTRPRIAAACPGDYPPLRFAPCRWVVPQEMTRRVPASARPSCRSSSRCSSSPPSWWQAWYFVKNRDVTATAPPSTPSPTQLPAAKPPVCAEGDALLAAMSTRDKLAQLLMVGARRRRRASGRGQRSRAAS